MTTTVVFRRKTGMILIMPILAFCTGFAFYIFIAVLKLPEDQTLFLWLVSAPAVMILLLLQMFHTIKIDQTHIVKGLLRKKIKISDIIRLGEGEFKGRLNQSSASRSSIITTYHILLMDSSGKKMRINWMGYQNGSELRKKLIELTGHEPEELYTDGIFGMSFYPVEKCSNCGQTNEGEKIKCRYCGHFLQPPKDYDQYLKPLKPLSKKTRTKSQKDFSFRDTRNGLILGYFLIIYSLVVYGSGILHFSDIPLTLLAPFPYPSTGIITALLSFAGFFLLQKQQGRFVYQISLVTAILLIAQPQIMRFFIIHHSETEYEGFVESFIEYQPVYPFIVSGAVLLALVLLWNKIRNKK